MTSSDAFAFMQERVDSLGHIAADLKVAQVKEVAHRVSELQDQLKEATKKNGALQAKLAAQQAGDVFNQAEETAKGTLIAAEVKVAGMDQLRQMADDWRQKDYSDVLVLATAAGDKVNLLVAVKDGLAKTVKAGDLIKAIAPAINGGGGGRPTLAQAGGKNPAGISEALKLASQFMND